MSRLPAIDAALARFDAWWNERSSRERAMLAGLGLFLGGLFLVFAVIKPIQDARARAFADIRTYETLNARIRAAGTLTPGLPASVAAGGTPIEAVNASATALGLVATVERVGAGVRATVADGSYDAVMGWIAEIGASRPLRVARVSIRNRPAPGRVAATVEFAP